MPAAGRDHLAVEETHPVGWAGTNKLWSNGSALRGTWRSEFSGNGDPVQDWGPSQWRGKRGAIGGEIALPLLNGMVTPQ